MLFSSDFVKAEHKCRMDAMQDQPKPASGRVGRTAGAVVVATLVSAALAACGDPADAGIAVDAGIVVKNRVIHDQAPTWQPNERLLREIMSSHVGSTQVVIPWSSLAGWPPLVGNPTTADSRLFLGPNQLQVLARPYACRAQSPVRVLFRTGLLHAKGHGVVT